MKKLFIMNVFLIIFTVFSFSQEQSINDLKYDFFGIWNFEGIYYTVSNDRLVAHMPEDNTGFTITINSWEYIVNIREDSINYPNGFKITGIMVNKTGNWWIDIGDSFTWIWFLNIDKNSFIDYDEDDGNVFYLRK